MWCSAGLRSQTRTRALSTKRLTTSTSPTASSSRHSPPCPLFMPSGVGRAGMGDSYPESPGVSCGEGQALASCADRVAGAYPLCKHAADPWGGCRRPTNRADTSAVVQSDRVPRARCAVRVSAERTAGVLGDRAAVGRFVEGWRAFFRCHRRYGRADILAFTGRNLGVRCGRSHGMPGLCGKQEPDGCRELERLRQPCGLSAGRRVRPGGGARAPGEGLSRYRGVGPRGGG